MNRLIKHLLFCFLLASNICFAQTVTREELQKKTAQIKKDIDKLEKYMKDIQLQEDNSLDQLKAIRQKVKLRESLIRNFKREVNEYDQQINENKAIVESMAQDLDNLRKEYAKMIYYAYKNRNAYSKLMYIFSSEDFTQAYQRMKYLQQISDYRQKQAAIIEKTQKRINEKIVELGEKQKEKVVVLESMKSQRSVLDTEKAKEEKLLKGLRSKENEYKKKLRAKERESKALFAAIKKMLDAETPGGKFVVSREVKLISENFESNKQRLPWPVTYYNVTTKFGPQPDPVLEGIVLDYDGIDIATKEGAPVKCIFSGEVRIIRNMGNAKVVIVKHGLYYSVYQNLKGIVVAVGDKIETGQEIGVVKTEDTRKKTEVHFQLWKNTKNGMIKLDPENWLIKN